MSYLVAIVSNAALKMGVQDTVFFLFPSSFFFF